MIAVAIVARRARLQVALHQQRLAVNALAPLGIFIARERPAVVGAAGHVLQVGMAFAQVSATRVRYTDDNGSATARIPCLPVLSAVPCG